MSQSICHHQIEGPCGNIEVMSTSGNNGLAVICHPHSLHGGTMHNKVVHTLASAMQRLNIATIRFNFRGVGKSTGEYAAGIGEQDDLAAVVAWGKQHFACEKLILGGFSFGSFVAFSSFKALAPTKLISIGPPVNNFDFADDTTITAPWLIVHGRQDEVVPCEDVVNWLKTRPETPQLEIFEETTHFFHGKLIQLRECVEEFVAS